MIRLIEQRYPILRDTSTPQQIKSLYESLQPKDEEGFARAYTYFQSYTPLGPYVDDLHLSPNVQVKAYKNCLYFGEMFNG
jgi:hypothetical protein